MVRLEHEDKVKLKREIRRIVGTHADLSKYKLFFFGSRVTGKGDAHSDIDLGIEGEAPLPAGALGSIEEEIAELPILYRIDVVDFKKVSVDFYEVAKRGAELIE